MHVPVIARQTCHDKVKRAVTQHDSLNAWSHKELQPASTGVARGFGFSMHSLSENDLTLIASPSSQMSPGDRGSI
jgi:hypothetical protein